jgi:hypothetical protein
MNYVRASRLRERYRDFYRYTHRLLYLYHIKNLITTDKKKQRKNLPLRHKG